MEDPDLRVKECMAACEDQKHSFLVTQAAFPNLHSFGQRPEYCVVVNKLAASCGDKRRPSLDEAQPGLCSSLEDVLGDFPDCRSMQIVHNPAQDKLVNATVEKLVALQAKVSRYARENMALVNIYIREPYAAGYVTEEKITEIAFVGNVGGLLGLFLGFSFVSIVEIVYLCACATKKKLRVGPGEVTAKSEDTKHSLKL